MQILKIVRLCLYIVVPGFILTACSDSSREDRLPILGNREPIVRTVDGKQVTDTAYHTIPEFRFLNQDSTWVSQDNFQNAIYVADFFFATCPTICPKMKTQMLRIYEKYQGNPEVKLLSHTIDPEHDTVAVLRNFAESLGVEGDQWMFVTGDREKIYEIGQESYLVTAGDDPDAPGGKIHSGAFILIDKEKRIRGYYDGTNEQEVDRLMNDMDKLLAEYRKQT